MIESTKRRKKKKSSGSISVNPLSDARRVYAKNSSVDSTAQTGNEAGNENESPVKSNSTDDNEKQQQHEEKNKKKRKLMTVDKNYSSAKDPTGLLTKADLKARELWHKKSGAGYSFFVQYYASQPPGVVTDNNVDGNTDGNTNGDNKKTTAMLSKINNNDNKGQGQSRAAKKRRKKKGNKSIPNNDKGTTTTNSKETNEQLQPDNSSYPTSSISNNCNSNGKNSDGYMISPELQHAMQRHPNSNHLRAFLGILSQQLPLTFRIRQNHNDNGNNKSLQEFKQTLTQKYHHLVKPVPYDPTESIYQAVQGTNLIKATLGKISPELKSLILQSTSNGLIARQELGSMLPVIALAGGKYMNYGSKVLDMCSSPGSKTLQALEIVTASYPNRPHDKKYKQKKLGRIVANDIHPLRIESLKDAISRSGLSTTLTDRIIYTNHDASTFPTPKSGKLFDCIIADVPCSGDGTIRKDPRILSGWMPSIGNSLHFVQKKILKRALRLVKVGGVVAYSTCSLNPIEDEAVVASVLSWANDVHCDSDEGYIEKKVELLEWPTHILPKIKRRKGVSTWRVANYVAENEPEQESDQGQNTDDDVPQLQWYNSFEKANEDKVPHVVQSMWPPLHRHSKDMKLDRCVRLRPQDNDTGGFFVALLRRVS